VWDGICGVAGGLLLLLVVVVVVVVVLLLLQVLLLITHLVVCHLCVTQCYCWCPLAVALHRNMDDIPPRTTQLKHHCVTCDRII
jgi:hypothetical protein